jgi:murein DD-endopeptidase MepM/ murein hydrolase activator NlpD
VSFSGGIDSAEPGSFNVSYRAPKAGLSGAKLFWPVADGRLVSSFGPRNGSFHDGVDIACSSGTPVYAAHSGTVLYSDNKLSGYGNLLIVKGNDQLITVYAHNRKLLAKAGSSVKRGQMIAEVGSTGRSSGPHLHFEVRTKDRRGRTVAVDPLPLLNDTIRSKPRYRVNESLTPLLAKVSRPT